MFRREEFDFLSFFTDLAVPITASICFSITKGDKEVIGLSSSFDLMTRCMFVVVPVRSKSFEI